MENCIDVIVLSQSMHAEENVDWSCQHLECLSLINFSKRDLQTFKLKIEEIGIHAINNVNIPQIESENASTFTSTFTSTSTSTPTVTSKFDIEIDNMEFKCQICLELSNRYYQHQGCKSKPSSCQQCFKENIECQIRENNLKFKCTSSECRESFHLYQVPELSSEPEFKEFSEKLMNVYKNTNPDIILCPKEFCNQINFVDRSESKKNIKRCNISCESCSYEFCSRCKEDSHEGNCINMESEHFKICPECDAKIERSEGCYHIVCFMCKYEFCWICLEKYSSNHMKDNHKSDQIQQIMEDQDALNMDIAAEDDIILQQLRNNQKQLLTNRMNKRRRMIYELESEHKDNDSENSEIKRQKFLYMEEHSLMNSLQKQYHEFSDTLIIILCNKILFYLESIQKNMREYVLKNILKKISEENNLKDFWKLIENYLNNSIFIFPHNDLFTNLKNLSKTKNPKEQYLLCNLNIFQCNQQNQFNLQNNNNNNNINNNNNNNNNNNINNQILNKNFFDDKILPTMFLTFTNIEAYKSELLKNILDQIDNSLPQNFFQKK